MDIDIILNEFTSPQQAAELGLLAESYGIRGVWSSNYGDTRDPFLTLALLAHQSKDILMGPLAVSPYELHPLKMANQLFALNELSGGRATATGGDRRRGHGKHSSYGTEGFALIFLSSIFLCPVRRHPLRLDRLHVETLR